MASGINVVVPGGPKAVEGLAFTVDPSNVAQPILRPVLEYWERKRGARPMPARHDIEPLELKPYLRHLFLIEVMPGADFRYRLLGSEITER
ncbi:MAG: PAS domain-containing protein, partial [Stellaceae bacterium]